MSTVAHRDDFDVAVVGGGLVGAAVAYGLGRLGSRVAVLDEGDLAVRASRANFALVWVQSKGLGMPEYAGWTVASAEAWPALANALKRDVGLDVHLQQPGGFHLALSESELETRANTLKRFHNQAGVTQYATEIMRRDEVAKSLPEIGPEVVGGSYCPLDGHVNSLKLFRALHAAMATHGTMYLPGHAVRAIERDGGAFRVTAGTRTITAGKVVLAAGNANQHLAPMVGLKAPMRPERGQIVVTERVRPFLKFPVVTIRQTDEGTVMLGDSKEEGTDPAGLNLEISSVIASRAVRTFPLLGKLNVVRSWRGIRVMPADGFPIYDQSATAPGAFIVTCHSGVTLAAGHALTLAPMIHAGRLDGRLDAFSARRFDVQKIA
ncbi:MAG: NAD(P)/FAD-dependent oxidoreductase [Hyphomicrobiaceae bacterium]